MKKLLLIAAAGIFLIENVQSQNVGIGIANPQSTLHVKGNHILGGVSSYLTHDTATGRIEWRNSNLYVPVTQALMKHSAAADGLFYNNTNPISGQLEYRNAAGEPVFYTNFTNGNGYFKNNLGIGATNPGARLHVANGPSGYSSGYFPGAIIEGNTNSYLNFLTPDFNESGVLFGKPSNAASGGIIYNNFNNYLQFRTNDNTTKMIIDQSGSVGIGTEFPQAKFHLVYGPPYGFTPTYPGAIIQGGGDIYLSVLSSLGETGVVFGTSTHGASGGLVYNNSANPEGFQFRANGNITRMSIDQSGNVDITGRLGIGNFLGIGNPSPTFPLHFASTTGDKIAFSGGFGSHYGIGLASNYLFMHSNGPASDIAFGTGGWGFFEEKMRIKGNGNVGIGTTTPQTKLEVNGYTMLGSSAPKIQMKKLTGTTAPTQGGTVNIPHGVGAGKILSMDVLVEYGPNGFVHHSYTESAGYQFNFFFGSLAISIVNVNGNSAQILSKPFRILITYEE